MSQKQLQMIESLQEIKATTLEQHACKDTLPCPANCPICHNRELCHPSAPQEWEPIGEIW